MKHKHTPPREFSAGHFTELVVRHYWPPMFESSIAWSPFELKRQQAAEAGRVAAPANGNGWAAGTILLPGTPKHAAPGKLERVA